MGSGRSYLVPAIKTHTIHNGVNHFLEFTLGSIRLTYQLQVISISNDTIKIVVLSQNLNKVTAI